MNYGQILMTNEDGSVIETEYTPEFKRNLRALAKKYRHIRSDIQPVIRQIQSGSFGLDLRLGHCLNQDSQDFQDFQ